MRKLIVLLILLDCCCSTISAQDKKTDSLRQVLSTVKEDTGKVLLMADIATSFLYSIPDTALFIAQQGLQLADKIDFKKGQILCLRLTGNVFQNTGNYPRALKVYLQAFKIAEEINDDQTMGRILSSLADVYFYEGDFKRSIDYSHRTIAMDRKNNNRLGLSRACQNLGDTYEKTNQLDSALFYTRTGFQIAVERGDKSGMGIGRSNLGNIFLKLGKLDSAMYYYRSSIPYAKEINNLPAFCETYLGIAKIFLHQHKDDSSLYYAKSSFRIAKEGEFTDQVLAASNFLTDYYGSRGNVDSAYAFLKVTAAAKDSLFGQQKANQVQSMTFDESTRQQQIEEAKEQERIRLKQGALIGGLAALLIVAFILYRNNRQKRKANALLQKQKEEIDVKARELSEQKENLQQSYDNVEQLGEIGRKITSSLSVEKIIGTVYDNVNTLMDASVFGIGIYNDATNSIDFPATYEEGGALPFYSNSIEDLNRFAVICFRDRKEIIMGNLNEEHKFYIQQVQTPHEGKQPVSLIYLPLTVKEKILGVITVQSFQFNAYSDYHVFMLRNIAIYTAIALDNAHAFETLNQTVVRLKATQSQLIQSEKMASLGELTAGIAHEIQNPLNFVNNFSEVNNELIEEMEGENNLEEIRAIAKNIKQNNSKISFHGKRADAIVKGMLQHSRKEAGLRVLTDINALCDEYLRLSFHGMRAKDKSFNVDFKLNFDDSIGKIQIVPQDIGRVLLNLYNNAFYAVQEKTSHHKNGYLPVIHISTKKQGDTIQLSIRDNGNGISEKNIDKIFQPFFTTKPTGRGTGLGLSLSYDIVKAHGGEIKVHTKEEEGSEFIVELPADSVSS
jgi:signal transduction histidine kinase/tetratricopeptide (TPR) repeat protein